MSCMGSTPVNCLFIYSTSLVYSFGFVAVKYNKIFQGEMFLGLWGKLWVMAIGTLVVIVAVVVVACFVGPGCWGFEYLRREEKKKKLSQNEKLNPEKVKITNCKLGNYYWPDSNDYVIYQTGPYGLEKQVAKIHETSLYRPKESILNVKCAPLLVTPNFYSSMKESHPKLEIKLYYMGIGSDEVMGRLSVNIISATSLPCREYVYTLDPFVVLDILNNKWSLQKNERIVHTVQTRVVKNNMNPTFDQTFVFDVKKMQIKNWCLKFTIVDNDRLTRATPLFEKRLHLKDVKNLTEENHVSLNLEMGEIKDSIGSLLFGISYLPTAQRLNISVIKASKLKYQTFTQSLVEFYPYVRVVMLDNHGKCLKKKKTCFRRGDDSPVYNESLIFDLSISNLEQTAFLVLLCTKSLIQIPNSDDSSLDGDSEISLKDYKDKVLGTIVLGRNVKCTRARDHWVTVMQNPRKMISVWHDLR